MKRSRPIEPAVKDEDFESGERNPSLAGRAYRRIKEKILMGEIPPLAAIDDRALMAELKTGRTPIREALQRLAFEGLVTVIPYRGTMASGIDMSDLDQIMEIRIPLEILAGRAAAQRAAAAEIEALRTLVGRYDIERLCLESEFVELLRLDLEFHSAVTEMERLGVAGGIIWDIDGQQTDVSYLGDPPDFETISPELVGVLDTFIGRFIAAGFPVGFTLRPQQTTISQGFLSNVGTAVTWVSGTQFDPSWAGDPSVVEGAASLAFGVNTHIIATWNSATSMTLNSAPAQNFVNVPFVAAQQLNNGDPHGVLKAKIQYCINRWGAQWMRYFYVDSNLDFKGNLTPASVFQQLTQDFPGIIFAPEWKNPQHYAYTHPWIDMQNGNFMPAFISEVTYQKATGMVRTPTDGASSNPTVQAQILNAILAGNTMLCDAWFRHTANDVILAAYQQAATIIPPTPPPVPPTPPGGGPTPVNGPKHVANYSYAVLGS